MRSALFSRVASAAVFAFALSAPVLAQQATPSPEHLAVARAVIDFTGASRSFDSVVPQLLQEARGLILTTRPELKNDLDAAIADVTIELKKSEQDILTSISQVYASKFTESELKDIAAFYQSPVGQKLTKAMPDILRESYTRTQEWAQKLSVDVMNKLRDAMAKKGHNI